MAQEITVTLLLKRAQYLLEEGRREQALSVLESIRPHDEAEQRERAYLLGWSYTLMRRWEEALSTLTPIPELAELEADSLPGKKLVHCLLRLGDGAVNLYRFEDADKHFRKCLKVLRVKKLDLPLEQAQAYYRLAGTQSMRGLFPAAEQSYHEAEKCLLYCVDVDNEEYGHIHYGLAYLYRNHTMGKYIEARLEALKALECYSDSMSEKRMHNIGITHNLMGDIAILLGDYQEASSEYSLALAIAPQYSGWQMCTRNCMGLARVRMEEHRFAEADEYCSLALEYAQKIQEVEKRDHLIGLAYVMFGKVAQKKAEDAEPPQREHYLHEAITRFEQAREKLLPMHSYADVAELYGRWAQVLEDLGQQQEALKCWKYGYEALAAVNDPSLN